MRLKDEKGYSKGYSWGGSTLCQSLANTGFILYKCIVYIYILIKLHIRMYSYAVDNIYNRGAMHSTLYTDG
jgi:hypothetical protein